MSRGQSEEGAFYGRASGDLAQGSHFKQPGGSSQPGMQMVKTAVQFNGPGPLKKKEEEL